MTFIFQTIMHSQFIEGQVTSPLVLWFQYHTILIMPINFSECHNIAQSHSFNIILQYCTSYSLAFDSIYAYYKNLFVDITIILEFCSIDKVRTSVAWPESKCLSSHSAACHIKVLQCFTYLELSGLGLFQYFKTN